ncbi:MAG: hypothetical protein ACO4B4_05815 [Planctomycetota bacterium]|jgi:tetratricopeptide (TPR) repeat protein
MKLGTEQTRTGASSRRVIGAALCALMLATGASPLTAQVTGDPEGAPVLGAEFLPAAAGLLQDGGIDELTIEAQRRRAASAAATADAKRLMDDLRYLDAEDRLRQAIQLDPNNQEARDLLELTLAIVGERGPEIQNVADEIERQRIVAQRQAVVEIERLYAEARRQMTDEEYSLAIDNLDMVLERIRWFPYPVDLSSVRAEAQAAKEQALQLQRELDTRVRREREIAVRANANRQMRESLEYIENRIDEMQSRMRRLYRDREFEEVMNLADQILELDPTRLEVREIRREAAEMRHFQETMEVSDRSREEWDRTFLSQLESDIPYTEIFNFPSSADWNRIASKRVSVDARVRQSESQRTKDIRAALQQRVSVGFTEDDSLSDVLTYLSTVTGINFILNREAVEELEGADGVELAQVSDLPVKNVLNLVLESMDPPFGYLIKNGAVIVGPSESISADIYLDFYEVTDLTKAHPDFPAPKLALESSGEGGDGGGTSLLELGGDEDETKLEYDADVLQGLIEASVYGEDGPPDGETIEIQGGKLVVRSTLENHQKVQRLLEALRKSTGVMVTVESRFIDLQDNFLTSIGVDFGNPFNSNLPNPISDIDGSGTAISAGYEFVDAQQQTNVRAAVYNAYSLPLGSSVAPFELSDRGGFALQYNVLDTFIMEAILEAQDKSQEFKSVSAPRVTAFNTQTSHSLVIDQSAYIRDAEVNQTGVVPVINPVIGILNSGSILQVRPTVSHDRRYVILEIEPTLAVQLPSRFKTLTLGLTTLNVEFPVLSVTNIKTTVTIPDGGTVLVGGLKRTISQDSRIGVPGLSRLPMMDFLLGRKGQAQMQSNLFVLISAKITVIRDEEAKRFN